MFGIADDICIAGIDDMGRGHNATPDKVLRICRQANLKLNTDKFLFLCTRISSFGEVISQSEVSPDTRKVQVLMAIPPPGCKIELQSFLGIVN